MSPPQKNFSRLFLTKLCIFPLCTSFVISKEMASKTAKIAANKRSVPEFGTMKVDSYPISAA